MTIRLTSSAFADGAAIPARHTCQGEDLSPPLAWSQPPVGTVSLALVVDDPDAPAGDWVHWVLYNLPGDATTLPEGVAKTLSPAGGALQGKNDFNTLGYNGPCPPRGTPHRYFFKLYALDRRLDLAAGATKANLLQAMRGHILDQGQLMGAYQRK